MARERDASGRGAEHATDECRLNPMSAPISGELRKYSKGIDTGFRDASPPGREREHEDATLSGLGRNSSADFRKSRVTTVARKHTICGAELPRRVVTFAQPERSLLPYRWPWCPYNATAPDIARQTADARSKAPISRRRPCRSPPRSFSREKAAGIVGACRTDRSNGSAACR